MNTNHPWRKHRNVFLPSIALACICIIASATIAAWSLTVQMPLNALQLKFSVIDMLSEFTGSGNHTIEFVTIGLGLIVTNPSGSDSPPILFEEPSVSLNGWRLPPQRIVCQGTSFSARSIGELTVQYVALCDTLQPVIMKPNQVVDLGLHVTIYNNTDNLPNAFWHLNSGGFKASLSGSLTVRPFYDQAVPNPQTQGWRSQIFWASRDFNITTTTLL